MALELINDGTAHPARLEAVYRYCLRQDKPLEKTELGRVFMPTTEDARRPMFLDVIKHLVALNLVTENKGYIQVTKKVQPENARIELGNSVFQLQNDSNLLFAQYYAWLIRRFGTAGNREFDRLKGDEKAAEFNREMAPDSEERLFNDTKERSFRIWAQYLGLGHITLLGSAQVFIPLPVAIIDDNLNVNSENKVKVSASNFVARIGKVFPFLDHGPVFSQIEASLGKQNTLTPAVSASLRLLHDEGKLKLISSQDAPNQVLFSRDNTHEINYSVNRVEILSQ